MDVGKFICAILILSAHFAAERASFPTLLDYAFSIYVIAVPFFYTASGFLLFDRFHRAPRSEHRGLLVRNVKRIAVVYLAWSLIYFGFVLLGWIRTGVSTATVLRYLHTSLVFTTYPTIWFLPALAVGLAATYFLSRRLSVEVVFLLGLVAYVLGAAGYSYSFVQEGLPLLESAYRAYSEVFVTTRNGLFNGFPFVALGALLASRSARLSLRLSGFLTAASLALVAVEAFALRVFFQNVGADTVFALIPFTFFLFEFLLALELKDSPVYRQLRSLSVLVFVSQRLFLTALPSILPVQVMDILTANSYVGLVAIILLTVGFSLAVLKASERIRTLRVLY